VQTLVEPAIVVRVCTHISPSITADLHRKARIDAATAEYLSVQSWPFWVNRRIVLPSTLTCVR
jgi:hypothetical protein